MVPLVIVGAGLALLALASGDTSRPSGLVRGPAPGGSVEVLPGVRLSPVLLATLHRVSVVTGLPIVATSGDRSAFKQAGEMLETLATQGPGGLGIYRAKELIQELLDAPRDVTSWTAILARWAERGVVVSAHMRGAGVDLRSWSSLYSPGQLAQLVAALRRTGARVTVEIDHIHAEWPA